MYKWYQGAACCYAYFQDVGPGRKPLSESVWFKRGWTLQELLAPKVVKFFDYEWTFLGTKKDLAAEISEHTPIHVGILQDGILRRWSVAQKMSWAADRETSVPEDTAYCLLGIFDVNMVPIYGEGEKAFIRLQEEIIKHNDDHSIFAWSMESLPA